MMRFKNLKYVMVLCLLMAFSSCSEDNSLEIVDDTSVEELNIVTTKSGSSCDTSVAINYNFVPGLSVAYRNTLKVYYRAHMAQYFTICEVQELGGDCVNSEIWRVNGQEFYNADPDDFEYPDPKGGTSGSNGEGDEEDDFDPEMHRAKPADYEDCFDEKEENLNNHLSGH